MTVIAAVDVVTDAFDVDCQALEAVLADAMPDDTVPSGDWTLDVRLTDDVEIGLLHGHYFNDPSPTDVITFPDADPAREQGGHLGDIVVSIERAREQSVDAGHSTTREVAFLILHGLLHLLGMTDETDQKRSAMLERQEAMLRRAEARAGVRL